MFHHDVRSCAIKPKNIGHGRGMRADRGEVRENAFKLGSELGSKSIEPGSGERPDFALERGLERRKGVLSNRQQGTSPSGGPRRSIQKRRKRMQGHAKRIP